MIPFLLILFLAAAVYFALRLFLVKKSLANAAKDLAEITENLEENRILKLNTPEKELEVLLDAVNQNLKSIRSQRITYQKKELQLKEQIENISHDLRTPLTAILGYLKMIDAKNLSCEEQEFLETAIRKSHTLQNLIVQFYELSLITSENFHLNLDAIDAARLLREACLDHYALFEQKQLHIQLNIPETAVIIRGDADALNRVFSNLIQNSIRYAKSEFHVQLKEDPASKAVLFLFSNDITPNQELSDPTMLFERFYMQEQSRNQGGTGLGLTISKTLIERMNGEIWAEYTGESENRFLNIMIRFSQM